LGNYLNLILLQKNEKDGTGIGLYMSKIIIEQRMHGHIELENVFMGVCCRISVKASTLY